jgi:hypothetical protein
MTRLKTLLRQNALAYFGDKEKKFTNIHNSSGKAADQAHPSHNRINPIPLDVTTHPGKAAQALGQIPDPPGPVISGSVLVSNVINLFSFITDDKE